MNFKLPKINAILIAISFVVIVVGFALMIGEPSTDVYNPDIFSVRRITVGPMTALFGFCLMIFAIMYKGRKKNEESDKQNKTKQ